MIDPLVKQKNQVKKMRRLRQAARLVFIRRDQGAGGCGYRLAIATVQMP